MHTFALQLERLRRHYQVSFKTYDEVSLLDLSHSLRIWADLKNALPRDVPAFASTVAFKSALPAKKVMRAARGCRFIFAYMPDGVLSYAANGQLAAGPDFEGPNGAMHLAIKSKLNSDGSIELRNFCYIGLELDEVTRKALVAEDVSRGNYAQWLGAEVVRLAYPGISGKLEPISISRESIIRRVANTLNGSHPSCSQDEEDGSNRLDAPIHFLLQYKIGGLPLPYFILLKAAQDILEIAPKLLGKPRTGAA